jgi:hypothetical protein
MFVAALAPRAALQHSPANRWSSFGRPGTKTSSGQVAAARLLRPSALSSAQIPGSA